MVLVALPRLRRSWVLASALRAATGNGSSPRRWPTPRGAVGMPRNVVKSLPPSRALRLVVPEARKVARWEAGPRRRGRRNAVAAFGPAPAAPGLMSLGGVSSAVPGGGEDLGQVDGPGARVEPGQPAADVH